MPTFASRVLGRSVGRPTTRLGKAPVTQRNGRVQGRPSRRVRVGSRRGALPEGAAHVRLDQGLTVSTVPVRAINDDLMGLL